LSVDFGRRSRGFFSFGASSYGLSSSSSSSASSFLGFFSAFGCAGAAGAFSFFSFGGGVYCNAFSAYAVEPKTDVRFG
jgi:hypothetical protein